MDCPYCFEEINSRAVVCKHCKRDLFFFVPIHNRITEMENEIAELKIQIQTGLPQNINPEPNIKSEFPIMIYILSIIIGVFAGILFYSLFRKEGFPSYYLILSIISPLPAGFLIGFKLKEFRFKLLLVGGLIIGMFNLIGTLFTARVGLQLDQDSFLVILSYFIGGALLYFSGGFIGNWVVRKYKKNNTNSYSKQIAETIVGRTSNKITDSNINEDKVQKLKKIIETIAPILTFIATILTALLTYLSKIK